MSEKQSYTNKTANIVNLESNLHTNQNPKKYDKNGDEIIWEMRLPDISSNLSFVILSWFFRIATLVLICYFFALGVDKYILSKNGMV